MPSTTAPVCKRKCACRRPTRLSNAPVPFAVRLYLRVEFFRARLCFYSVFFRAHIDQQLCNPHMLHVCLASRRSEAHTGTTSVCELGMYIGIKAYRIYFYSNWYRRQQYVGTGRGYEYNINIGSLLGHGGGRGGGVLRDASWGGHKVKGGSPPAG